jgi:hypothetical protein
MLLSFYEPILKYERNLFLKNEIVFSRVNLQLIALNPLTIFFYMNQSSNIFRTGIN